MKNNPLKKLGTLGQSIWLDYIRRDLMVSGELRRLIEEGTTSTPFDMVVINDLDRFHLVADVIDRVPALGPRATYVKQAIRDKLIEHKQYINEFGEDMLEICNWKWSNPQ